MIGLLFACLRKVKKHSVKKIVVSAPIFAFSWIMLCSQTWFSYLVTQPLESYSKAVQSQYMEVSDDYYIHVLACYYQDNSDIPMISRWSDCSLKRLVQAVLLHKKSGATIVLTGGRFIPESDVVYAEKAYALLLELGVDEDKIIALSVGTNTKEEVLAIKRRLSNKAKLALVSSTTHTERLHKLVLQAGFTNFKFFSVGHMNGEFDWSYAFGLNHFNLIRTERAFYEYGAQIKSAINE
ncbi:YdcF family protein [Agaribacter marinus]|uniref:YdcF family protein n=1 Tax=Agaribacter marinus TaxID=1431249 RepID=UPI0024E0D8B8|nr:YdcF family protein [Agaribacter marinus]